MRLKKTLLIGMVGALALPSVAQKLDLTSAIIEYKNRKNIPKAKEYIDKAYDKVEAGSTLKAKDLAKFWYYRGLIYQKSYQTDSLITSIESATEAYQKELEVEPSSYHDKSKGNLVQLSNKFVQEAYKLADAEAFAESVSTFDKAFAINKYFNFADTNNLYYSSVMALNAKDYPKTIALSDELIGLNPSFESYHINRLKAYKALDDKAEYEKALLSSKEKCVNCQNIILEEVNHYLGTGETEKLLTSLDNAIAATPDNALLYFAKGATVSSSDTEAAKASYLKAVEIDPNYGDAYVNLSGLFMEKANAIIAKMNDLGFSNADQAKYKTYEAERKVIYGEAKPYLEKSIELDPKNKTITSALMTVYYELGETDKWKETKAKYDALK